MSKTSHKMRTLNVVYKLSNNIGQTSEWVIRPVHSTPEEFENEDFTLKTHQCFPSTLCRRSLKTQQSAVILDLCLGKTRAGKSHDYRDVTVFEKLRFQIVFRPLVFHSVSITGQYGR